MVFQKTVDLALGDIALVWQKEGAEMSGWHKENAPPCLELNLEGQMQCIVPPAASINKEMLSYRWMWAGGDHANLLHVGKSLWTSVVKRAWKQMSSATMFVFVFVILKPNRCYRVSSHASSICSLTLWKCWSVRQLVYYFGPDCNISTGGRHPWSSHDWS